MAHPTHKHRDSMRQARSVYDGCMEDLLQAVGFDLSRHEPLGRGFCRYDPASKLALARAYEQARDAADRLDHLRTTDEART